jgi:hypothetical protein
VNASNEETPSPESNSNIPAEVDTAVPPAAVEPSLLELIQQGIAALFLSEDVIEVRVPKARGGKKTISGYYSDHQKMAEDLASLDGRHSGVYYTLNPASPSLLARAENRLKSNAEQTTSDPDITSRIHLLIDADPVRPAGISSTDEEKEVSRAQIRLVYAYLRKLKCPEPTVADSGNGYHLVYNIDLPNDKESSELVKAVLASLAARFDNPQSKIDKTVFNAARIVKAYGTTAAKGDNIASRPHRRSRVIKVGDPSLAVSREQLQLIAADTLDTKPDLLVPGTKNSTGGVVVGGKGSITIEKMEEFLEHHDVGNHGMEETKDGLKWVLDACPFNPDHVGKDAAIFLHDGIPGFFCFHNECQGHGWKACRERIEFTSGKKYWFGTNSEGGTVLVGGGKEIPQKSADIEQPWKTFADFTPKKLEWLWPGKLPLGEVTIFSGDPSLGKTLILVDLAARGSIGADFLDGTKNKIGMFETLLFSAEDSPDRTIVPRLIGMGADVSKLHTLDEVNIPNGSENGQQKLRKVPFNLTHLGALRAKLLSNPNIKLIIIDPITNYFGKKSVMLEQEAREILMPLSGMAQELNVTIVTVAHNSKQQGRSAMHKTIGAVGIVGVTRMGWQFMKDPDNGGRKLMLQMKENLGKFSGLVYNTKNVLIELDGEQVGVAGVEYLGPSEYKVDNLILQNEDFKEKSTQPAVAFLKHNMKPGSTALCQPLIEAAAGQSISKDQLDRARKKLDIESVKTAKGWMWVWNTVNIGSEDGHHDN